MSKSVKILKKGEVVKQDGRCSNLLHSWELPEKGQDASVSIWRRASKLLQERPQGHDFKPIKWHLVKYYGQNASRRPFVVLYDDE